MVQDNLQKSADDVSQQLAEVSSFNSKLEKQKEVRHELDMKGWASACQPVYDHFVVVLEFQRQSGTNVKGNMGCYYGQFCIFLFLRTYCQSIFLNLMVSYIKCSRQRREPTRCPLYCLVISDGVLYIVVSDGVSIMPTISVVPVDIWWCPLYCLVISDGVLYIA